MTSRSVTSGRSEAITMLTRTFCYVCAAPVDSAAVFSCGEAHCSIECATTTASRHVPPTPPAWAIDFEPGSEP